MAALPKVLCGALVLVDVRGKRVYDQLQPGSFFLRVRLCLFYQRTSRALNILICIMKTKERDLK